MPNTTPAKSPRTTKFQQQSPAPANQIDDSFRLSPRTNSQAKINVDVRSTDCLQLCLDIPFLDHPYLIGPRGRKSQYFMARYKSLIHFPDTNCRSDGLKLNNVLISGTMKNVEEIRTQVRLRMPIRVVINLNQTSIDIEHFTQQIEDAIAERSLPIRFQLAEDMKSALLKTEWRNEEMLVQFCDEFMDAKKIYPSGNSNVNVDELFTIGIALLPLINPWNQELSHRLVGSFYDQNGSRIYYPPKEKYIIQPPNYFVKGSTMAGVLRATKYLMGLTMIHITFYYPTGFVPDIGQQRLDDWQRDLLVHTTIYNPDSTEIPQYKVILRSFEFCINNAYFVRSALLGFKKSLQTSDFDFMKATKYLIPYTVFSEAKLFYPLYSIDDKNLHWDSKEFFEHFYGGPYARALLVAPPISSIATDGAMAGDEDVFHNQHQSTGADSEEGIIGHQQPTHGLELNSSTPNSSRKMGPPPLLQKHIRPFTPTDFRYIHLSHIHPMPLGHGHLLPPLGDPNNNPLPPSAQIIYLHTGEHHHHQPPIMPSNPMGNYNHHHHQHHH